ncbi:hypothetical protein [Streptomyces sp. 351MFTsu5.1]|uniref:hypothetical protein n=1 Tax=Streptomyces sp. 351MFTsu5.1 TaxID=1172180 RepID=UPI00036C401B|nr:hypothetical protein [Streptomyces sp. 351MFTsu5.1]
MSYPKLFTTPGLGALAEEIDAERQAQLAKWGVQLHPIIDPRDIPEATHPYYAGRADIWREVNAERATPSRAVGRCTGHPDGDHTHTAWDGILLEEVYEALAESDPAKRRVELVQVMAVCAAIIAADEAQQGQEQQAAESCGKCRTPFDPADTRFDGHARYAETPYCRRCVDFCHDTEIADHRCVICA